MNRLAASIVFKARFLVTLLVRKRRTRRATLVATGLVLVAGIFGYILLTRTPSTMQHSSQHGPATQQGPLRLFAHFEPDLDLTLVVSPLGSSPQTFTLDLTSGDRQAVSSLGTPTLEFTLLNRDTPIQRVSLDKIAAGRYMASGTWLSEPGLWRLRVEALRQGATDVDASFPLYVDGPSAPPALDPVALERLKQADARMNTLKSLHSIEELNDGANAVVVTDYQYQAPDRMRFRIAGRTDSIAIGKTQYYLEQDQWTENQRVEPFVFPSFDSISQVTEARLGRAEDLDGSATQIVLTTATYLDEVMRYAYWIGKEDGLVRQYAMVAPGHLMMRYNLEYNPNIRIEPPSQPAGETGFLCSCEAGDGTALFSRVQLTSRWR